jgi:hypothetical protein
VGLELFEHDADLSVEAMIQVADAAMYKNKHA